LNNCNGSASLASVETGRPVYQPQSHTTYPTKSVTLNSGQDLQNFPCSKALQSRDTENKRKTLKVELLTDTLAK